MANGNETVAEIVSEMRKITFGEECCPECGTDFQRSNSWTKFADRIEAAHRREIDHRALIAGVSLADAVDAEHKREIAAKDAEIAGLSANLKVAEDALENIYKCIDNRYGVDASMLAKNIIADALAAIRGEGNKRK